MRGSWFRCWFLVALGLLAAGQFQRFSIFSGAGSIYLHEVAFALAGLSLFGLPRRALTDWWNSEWILLKPLILFFVILCFSLAVRFILGETGTVGWLYLSRLFGYVLLWPLSAIAVRHHWMHKQDIFRLLVLLGYTYLILGLVQYLLIPDTRFLFWLGWDEHLYRAISTLLDPGFTAGLGVVALALTFPWLTGDDLRKKVVFGAGIIGLLFTYSRAGFLSFLGALMLWSVLVRNMTLGVTLSAVFVVSMFLLPRPESEGAKLERTASINSRVQSISGALTVNDPLELVIGEGWYLARADRTVSAGVQRSNASAPDNSVVHVFESAGILGVGALLWVLGQVIRRFSVRPVYLAAFVGVLIGSLFNNLLFYSFLLPAWMLLITLSGGSSLLSGKSVKGEK